ncbi:heat shock cognate 71 kDa protein-like [Bradysia coprophila]|uniref:heat shock cognate 71 kDa protein-like n=1 Tax=Bradysia coprophila TaxID=38358 RepID=UPI00187DA365|nr:heat shock cognate 71 kDa protein-like [Bradysia coprophila]
MESSQRSNVIGIDLGTTNSCVAVYTRGKIKIIPNEQGSPVTPSYASFTENEQLVGILAKNATDLHPKSTIFDIKRLIGRRWSDLTVQQDIEKWPFVLRNIKNYPHIEVEVNGEKKLFLPEQISAMVVSKMKKIAEDYLKKTVCSAVITVPAYFNDAQRQATVDAGRIAGLSVLKIINEPTSAACAYAYKNREYIKKGTNILVFDMGGGTLDVTILKIEQDYVTVKSTNGDTHLGGEDLDCRLVDYCLDTFRRKHNHDLKDDTVAIRRLRTECEKVKKDLSHALYSKVNVYHIYKDIDFSLEISRARFEQINGSIIKKTLAPVERALNDANLSKSQINKVILVGGCTRIPMLKSLLKDYFGASKINDTINVDTTVAYGAAVEAAHLSGKTMHVGGCFLRDVTPLSLGTDSEIPPTMSVIIPRNTLIPAEKTVTFSTIKDDQTSITIQIRQGESSYAHENYLVGKFELTGFFKSPKGVPWIDVTFAIDENGILTASAVDKTSGTSNSIKIDKCTGRLKKEKIDQLIKEGQIIQKEMEMQTKAKKAAIALEDEIFAIKRKLDTRQFEDESKSKVLKRCDELLLWVEDNKTAAESVYREKKREIRDYAKNKSRSSSKSQDRDKKKR